MKNDTLIRMEGMRALRRHMDIVETEKFITLIRHEPFDYTEWRRDLWKGKSVDDILNAAEQTDSSIRFEISAGT